MLYQVLSVLSMLVDLLQISTVLKFKALDSYY